MHSELLNETVCRLRKIAVCYLAQVRKIKIATIETNTAESTGFSTLLCCKQLIQQLECFFNLCQLLTVTWSHYCNQTSHGHITHASALQPSSFPLVIIIVGITRFVITWWSNEDSHATQKLLQWLCRLFKGFRERLMNDCTAYQNIRFLI